MTKALTLFSAIAMLQTGSAIAKPKHQNIISLFQTSELPDQTKLKFNALKANIFSNLEANKATATERLAILSNYDFTQSASVVDSIRLEYSNGRGSKFDFLSMSFNSSEVPYPLGFGNSYVNFDKALDMTSGGTVLTTRTYDAANRVTRNENTAMATVYQYDAAGRLSAITGLRFNTSNGSWDNYYREHYRYNSNGNLILDSAELWNSGNSTFEEFAKYTYTNDANGRRIYLQFEQGASGSYQTTAEVNYTYTGTSPLPSTYVVREIPAGGSSLVNSVKDTFGYSNGMIIYQNRYNWNTGASDWEPETQQFRHLNSANLPDSVANFYWSSGKAVDSFYALYTYNSQNNPTSELNYVFGDPTPSTALRMEYESAESAGIVRLRSERLEFYPNPASDNLQLKGLAQGNYQIHNTAGQLIQSGTLLNNAVVPVQSLTPGMYLLTVQDAKRGNLQANFVRL